MSTKKLTKSERNALLVQLGAKSRQLSDSANQIEFDFYDLLELPLYSFGEFISPSNLSDKQLANQDDFRTHLLRLTNSIREQIGIIDLYIDAVVKATKEDT